METKRSNMQHTTQYTSNGHRITTGSSKTQVMKNASEISLTPSQAAEQAKLNGRKHPLDALSKMHSRQPTVERRSGLQDVDDEYLKQNVFRKPYQARNSGLNDINSAQSEFNPPAAGQPSVPPAQAIPSNMQNPPTNQSAVRAQQQNFYQCANNLHPSHNQMQPQVQLAPGSVPVQVQQPINPIPNHAPPSAQQDFQKQNIQDHSTNIQGNLVQQSGQPTTMTTNRNLSVPCTPEPEMCTTCPNCQTTIYLVRGADAPHDMPPQAPNNAAGQQVVSDTANAV